MSARLIWRFFDVEIWVGVSMKVTKILKFWNQIRQGLVETIEKFSNEDLDYVVYENGYSVRQIILHIAQEEYGEIRYVITHEIDEFPPH